MKDIIEILEACGVSVPEEQRKTVRDGLAENYRTIADYNKQKEKLTAAEQQATNKDSQLVELSEKLKAMDASDAKIADLQKQIEGYEAAETERKAKAEKDAKVAAFEPKFAEALGERKFANKIVEQSVKSQAFEKSAANPDMDIKSIVDSITKDEFGIFRNPQQPEPASMPNPAQGGSAPQISTLDDVNKLSTKEINENWEQVQKVLARN